jgi:hypothetical protein
MAAEVGCAAVMFSFSDSKALSEEPDAARVGAAADAPLPAVAPPADAPPDVALPTAAAEWMGAIETRLRDVAGFYTWVAALPQSRRENWMFVKGPRVGVVEMEVDEEAHTQSRALGVQISVFTERPV